VEVAGDGRCKATEANIDADDEGLAGVEVRDFDDANEVLRAVGGVTKRRPGRLEELLDERGGLRAVEADVAVFAALLGVERRCYGTDPDVQDIGVADAYLAVVLASVVSRTGLVIRRPAGHRP
jgi:hypothetical protein